MNLAFKSILVAMCASTYAQVAIKVFSDAPDWVGSAAYYIVTPITFVVALFGFLIRRDLKK